jgi:predicted ABC-type ATPase
MSARGSFRTPIRWHLTQICVQRSKSMRRSRPASGIGVDFLVETVLSPDKYVDDIERALARGYQLGVIYVGLATPEDAVRRVALQRAVGGHDVPKDRIVARWSRSIAMLGRIVPLAHCLYAFDDTSTAGPTLIARKEGHALDMLAPGRIPEIDAVLMGARDGAP